MKLIDLSVDFDGVIHGYTSPWTSADEVLDPPVPGAIEWLKDILTSGRVVVHIFSTRNSQKGGTDAMVDWLLANGMTVAEVVLLNFPENKPRATIYVDDRGYRFEGDNFPPLDYILNFKPWNRK